MALGMMMVPATIALPFKLMLFVLVDGWQLLVGSLAQSFTAKRGKMTPESVTMMGTEAMKVALALAALCCWWRWSRALSSVILQAATQINEMTLSFIPKNHRRIYCHYYCRTVDAQSVAGLRPHLVH